MSTRVFEASRRTPTAEALARLTRQTDAPSRSQADNAHAWTSQALKSLRGVTILFVVAMHASMPYLAFTKTPALAFAQAPYAWLAFPIVDVERWFGFDLFAAWLDVYLMSLMFFLSGLFVRSGLVHKGLRAFIASRVLRVGAPFVFALVVVMPIALYPAYSVRSSDPSLSRYVADYLALGFLPNGPMWFLWILLALTLVLAALHRFVPQALELLVRLSRGAGQAPDRYFVGLASAATLAYVPLALAFSPWDWLELGPFSFQLCRPALYFVYYLAGYGVGAHGLGDGLLAGDGALAARWRVWLVGALASLLFWMGLTGLTLSYTTPAPLALQALAEVSYAWAGAASVLFVLGAALRLRALRSRLLDALSHNAFGVYLWHYAPLVWLQYELMNAPLSAVPKALIVFGGTLFAAYAGAVILTRYLILSRGKGRWVGTLK